MQRVNRNMRLLIGMIGAIRNWPEFLAHYTGWRKQAFTVRFRDGLRLAMKDRWSCITAAEIFIKRAYGEIQPGQTVIDIGAHEGIFSLYAGRQAGVTVYAYEPDSENFKQFQQTLALNTLAGQVNAFPVAIAKEAGNRDFFRGQSLAHSLYDAPNVQQDGKVPCDTLEHVFAVNRIDRCDVLKLDCEGAEFEILYTAPQHILDRIGSIRMEYHDWSGNNHQQLIAFLEQRGFVVEKVTPHTDSQGELWFIHA